MPVPVVPGRHPPLRGKVVLSTGAASKLGAALAETLALTGADIAATDMQHGRVSQRACPLGVDVGDPAAAAVLPMRETSWP